eukprot:SAG11_NODE_3194_length_2620_cov_2.356208_1_plen_154_part_00
MLNDAALKSTLSFHTGSAPPSGCARVLRFSPPSSNSTKGLCWPNQPLLLMRIAWTTVTVSFPSRTTGPGLAPAGLSFARVGRLGRSWLGGLLGAWAPSHFLAPMVERSGLGDPGSLFGDANDIAKCLLLSIRKQLQQCQSTIFDLVGILAPHL